MVGRGRILDILQAVLDESGADQTQAVILAQDSYLTRFSQNYIHQNVGERTANLLVKVIKGDRSGEATTNSLDPEGIRWVVGRALDIADVQPENPQMPSLPQADPVISTVGYSEDTAQLSPQDRAAGVRTLLSPIEEMGAQASGAYGSSVMELAVANSLGVKSYQLTTQASLRTVVMAGAGAGFAEACSTRAQDIDAGEVGRKGARKCRDSAQPQSVDPGEYTVILEPQAAAELVNYLVMMGFSAKAVQEGRSFLTGQPGQELVHPGVDIWDDGTDPSGFPLAFDFEGVPKSKLPLVEAGRAVNILHDSHTAAREKGQVSTGHAVPYAAYSPMALNLFMGTGEATLEDMIASTSRGILVTRFHYTNPIHPVKAMFTGMTRDGTFLVEEGRITRPLRNLRFTDSVIRALSQVEMIGSESELVKSFFGGTRVPPLKIKSFNFTGTTEH